MDKIIEVIKSNFDILESDINLTYGFYYKEKYIQLTVCPNGRNYGYINGLNFKGWDKEISIEDKLQWLKNTVDSEVFFE